MRKAWPILALGMTAAALAAGPQDDVPVAPVTPSEFAGWRPAFCLSNRAARTAVVPAVGRVAMFAPVEGTNLLHLAPGWIGRLPSDPEFARRWINFGGLALWPVAHAQWPGLEARGINPARLLDGYAWNGRAWQNAAGETVCVMTRDIGPPLGIRLTQDIRLEEVPPSLVVRQRVERTAESDVPVTLWTVGQLLRPTRIVLPIEREGEPADQLRPLAFDPPPAVAFSYHGAAAVYRVDVGCTHRFRSGSPRGWIAAEIGRTLVLLRTGAAGGGEPPSVFVERDAPYFEFEVAIPPQALKAGDLVENAFRIEAYPCPEGLTAAELAGRARRFLGELPEARPATRGP